MSDPCRTGPYECCARRMEAVTLLQLTGVASTLGTAAYVCRCGVWKHGFAVAESQLRAIVEKHMPAFIQARQESTK